MKKPIPLRQALREAKEAKRKAKGDAGLAEPLDCPVTPLGNLNGAFQFFDVQGQFRELTALQLGQRPLLSALFGQRREWLCTWFPQRDQDGQLTGRFNVAEACDYLIDRCMEAGLYRQDERRRGHGVWRAGDGVLVHLGREVLDPANGERTRAGFRRHGALWPALAEIAPPADQPATATDAMHVEAAFSRWRWEESDSGKVFFGLWAAGLLGAAIPWRPHGLVCGQAGSGKTTLLNLYEATSPVSSGWNDYTEAGLRQMLSGRAGPVVLDEAEGDAEGATRIQRTLELLRRTSGGSGAQVVRGSPGGKSQTFEVSAAAVLGAILPPVLLPQDSSRITRLDLLPWTRDATSIPTAGEIAQLTAMAPRLWARALAGLPRYHANLDVFRKELMTSNCPPRSADQLGAILSARAMMLNDEVLQPRQAAEDIDIISWLVVPQEELAEDSGPQMCLRHLLSSAVDVVNNGERPALQRLILKALDRDNGHDARRQLRDYGLRLATFPQQQPGGPIVLYVADRNPRLERIYADTPWAKGRWKEDLRRLPGALRPKCPQYVLTKERCTVLPNDLLPKRAHEAATFEEIAAIADDHGRDAAWIVEIQRSGMTRDQAKGAAFTAKT